VDERGDLHLRSDRRVEDALQGLRSSGGLSGLPGEGAPLPPDPDQDAGDAWAARHLTRTSAARPLWLELRSDIAHERTRIIARLRVHLAWLERREALLRQLPAERIAREAAATRRADERVRAELERVVNDLNALVRRQNLSVTVSSLELPLFTREGLLEVARAARR